MRKNIPSVLLAMLAQFVCLSTRAEDIDLFVGAPISATDKPNVLIVLDNTANWNTAFTNEIAALVSTIDSLPEDKFRVGLMLFTESGGGDTGNDGGYVRAAVRDFSAANKVLYQNLVSSLDDRDDKSNGGKLGKTMTDAYRYYAGQAPYSGNNKNKSDYAGSTYGTDESQAIYALPGNALPSKAGSPYVSPLVPGSCAGNYIIYISNGAVQDNNADTTAAAAALTVAASAEGITGATTAIAISPAGSQDNVGDEWARFMKQSSLGIITYTVDVDKVTTGQGPGWSALLKSMANVSSGEYFDVSSGGGGSQIVAALSQIFSEIQAKNSVFASVSLPVSVNTQGTYLNQVFVGMFRPDELRKPRWAGNLKQYKLGEVNGVLRLQDADNAAAINSGSGFITECARSYWTPSATDSYWDFKMQGGCLAVANSDASNYPDGNVVEKGAQAYTLRATTARTVKTCSTVFASCTALVDFNNTNVSQTALGAASTTERDTLINWAKGLDVDDEKPNSLTTTEMRPSVHGDVVHSRPVAINYGTDESPQVVVFYGDNSGVLHAINGNRSDSIGTTAAGAELWSFIAPEFLPYIKRLHDNTTLVDYKRPPVTTPTPTPLPKPYGVDGTVTAFAGTLDSVDKTFIYATLRRGGRVLYAFDVTDPANPSLKWKVGCPNAGNDTDCTDGYTGIGQTWSSAKVVKAEGYDGGDTPLLIMGGGYDPCEDDDPHTCAASTKGNRIYVIDADTGEMLRALATERAVIGDIQIVTDDDGMAKYGYAADLGGNVYRISGATANTPIGATEPGDWTITKIADLGCATPGACTAQRKFMFAPDVVEPTSGTYNLLLGSGDREKPLSDYATAYGVGNYFFMIQDKPTDAGWLASESTNCADESVLCLASLYPILDSATPTEDNLAAKKGWYLGLTAHEQVVTSAITVYGTVTFSTHQPAVVTPGVCSSNLGDTLVYNIKHANAKSSSATVSDPNASRYQQVSGGGLPPSPVAGMVTLDDGQTVPFVIGASPDSPIEGSAIGVTGSFVQPKSRIYWYIEQ